MHLREAVAQADEKVILQTDGDHPAQVCQRQVMQIDKRDEQNSTQRHQANDHDCQNDGGAV